MSIRAGAETRVASDADPAAAGHGSTTLYIINLISSTMPMALELPHAPELEGYAVFRSRRVEDGRDRFRLHLGYFESAQEAARVLALVRTHYPAAWVARAPQDSMGSLDDTGTAHFHVIRPGRASTSARAHAAQASPVAASPIPAAAPHPAAPSIHNSVVGRVPMTPSEVLQLLESTPRTSIPATARERGPAAASSAGPQKFAVQLIWSTKPVLAKAVPQLAIFEAYTLYGVRVERAGRRWYGLRLGFFTDPLSARQVALYARSDFSAAAVVPVSDRESARAAEVAAAAHAPPAPPVAKTGSKRDDEIVLTPDRVSPGTVAKSRVAQPAPVLTLVPDPPRERQETGRRRAATPPRAVQRPAAKRRSEKTAEELLEELGANELAIDTSGVHDALNDSGVRHLSVSVMTRQSPLARLLERVGRKRAH